MYKRTCIIHVHVQCTYTYSVHIATSVAVVVSILSLEAARELYTCVITETAKFKHGGSLLNYDSTSHLHACCSYNLDRLKGSLLHVASVDTDALCYRYFSNKKEADRLIDLAQEGIAWAEIMPLCYSMCCCCHVHSFISHT